MSDKPEAGDKTEAPTAKRRRDAAEQGDILRSRELSMAMVMMFGALYLALLGPLFVGAMADAMKGGLTVTRHAAIEFTPLESSSRLLRAIAAPVLGLFVVTIVAAVTGQAMLGSLTFNPKSFGFKASRMNPTAGFGRMFGVQGLIELGKALLKVVLVGAIGAVAIWHFSTSMAALGAEDVIGAIRHVGHLASALSLALAFGLVLVAGVDVPLQLFQLMRKLRMSKQEVKEELKQTEGSPEVKGALRRRARDILRNNVRKGVGEAHVILTNPTHFAVALRYDRANDRAPVVVAKGKDDLAQIIRELAVERQAPVLENPLLARAIFFTSRVGQEVRDDLYVAIAAILAFVFHVDRAAVMLPDVEIPDAARFDEHGKLAAQP